MLTTATTVLGLAPLLYERSADAQFLKPTVITLVYGLGFGMLLVLLVVPSLMAMQHDVSRQIAALKTALRFRRSGVRISMVAALGVVLAWLVATLGYVVVTGEMLPLLAAALPLMAGAAPLTAALALFIAGCAAFVLVLYAVGSAIWLFGRQRRHLG